MTEIVLHHYETSPFSELVRLALGLKRLEWRSVIIPIVAPKPDLVALTGGYRKTPVLQIGADIYCDTAIIVDVLERLAPEPTLFPAPLGQLARPLAQWAGSQLFVASVGTALSPIEHTLPEIFWEDRKALFGVDRARMLALAPHLRTQFVAGLSWIENTLSDGRAFVGGDAVSYADLALYMNVWFARSTGDRFPVEVLGRMQRVTGWAERVAAIGHGGSRDCGAQEALQIARDAASTVEAAVDPASGFEANQLVAVRTEDSGANPVEGQLVRLTDGEIVIRRTHEAVGEVAVHFPRVGQILSAAGQQPEVSPPAAGASRDSLPH